MLLSPTLTNEKSEIGGKAFHLVRLQSMGFKVPPFKVIPSFFLKSILASSPETDNPLLLIDQFSFPPGWDDGLALGKWYAVRSSAEMEDGKKLSFAGQFVSKLFVGNDQLEEAIKAVWASAFSETVKQYAKINNIAAPDSISVIIQEMVDAEVSGVAFGINPISGENGEHMISAVFGLGEGLVSGELEADNFLVKNGTIEKHPVKKEWQLKHASKGILSKQDVAQERQNDPCLTDGQLMEISKALSKLESELGLPQDVEFSIQDGQIYLLQTRPVTATGKQISNYILWDNSNIIESYPGVTTPLTFSFIRASYEGAYKQLSAYFGVSNKVIEQHKEVFANTLGLIRGRVYYNLKSWYLMLALLPGYSINARYMETMMGVKERFDLPKNYHTSSKLSASLRMILIILKMIYRYFSIDRERKKFMNLLNRTISTYKAMDFSACTADELVELYLQFEQKLLNEWKAPLLNDLFAMIAFGGLQKKCAALGLDKDNPNIHNDLLCGSSDIISVEPIHRTIEIASLILENAETKEWFLGHTDQEIWSEISSGKHPWLKEVITDYLHDFGERCIGELKLETISYKQDPTLFVRLLRSYVSGGIVKSTIGGGVEQQLRVDAEKIVFEKLKYRPIKRYFLRKSIKNTRVLVSNRENLRYERTRAFGMVRELFTHIGIKFSEMGIIKEKRDVFYLSKEEVVSFVYGTSISTHLMETIELRKNEFAQYENEEMPSERFATYGTVNHGNDFYAQDRLEAVGDKLQGIGCCPGRVTAKVQVVKRPDELDSLGGDILVTSSTDPGWVVLFPTASAILVERGSLLSHSAIVSREMGIPCIVGITGLLKKLKTGDEVIMDGSTGEVVVL